MIDKTALNAEAMENEEQTEASRLVQQVIEAQTKQANTTNVTVEYRSKGEPFMDLWLITQLFYFTEIKEQLIWVIQTLLIKF